MSIGRMLEWMILPLLYILGTGACVDGTPLMTTGCMSSLIAIKHNCS